MTQTEMHKIHLIQQLPPPFGDGAKFYLQY